MATSTTAASEMAASGMAPSEMAASDLCLCKAHLGETGCLGSPYLTFMVTYSSLYSPCATYGTLCHAIGHLLDYYEI